jgi:hypothetical protein
LGTCVASVSTSLVVMQSQACHDQFLLDSPQFISLFTAMTLLLFSYFPCYIQHCCNCLVHSLILVFTFHFLSSQ